MRLHRQRQDLSAPQAYRTGGEVAGTTEAVAFPGKVESGWLIALAGLGFKIGSGAIDKVIFRVIVATIPCHRRCYVGEAVVVVAVRTRRTMSVRGAAQASLPSCQFA